MSCTTVLVGKNASNDGSTMIARTDDGHFDVKKMTVVRPKDQPRKYTSKISHVTIELPDDPISYTSCPSVDLKNGIWAATGINKANVGMTATETITSNPRVLAADPLVEYKKATKRGEKDIPGGIGEEDIVLLVLPYIRTAREGILRLASLLEEYGTYESNGIAINDENEVWWMETIGGHHWLARKVPDDVVVVHPNQFGMDAFDFDDAFGEKKEHLCSEDMLTFIAENHLDLNQNGKKNPRDIFGSHSDMDHVYNTPRAWFLGKFLAPNTYKWDGEDADYRPDSDNLPWCLVPERKVTVEDMQYMLSAHYQGTDFDPYISRNTGKRGMYRSIGINRTGITSICQIRPYAPEPLKGIEWVCFGPTTFSAMLPLYTYVNKVPAYLSKVTLDVSTENLYWASRLISALADTDYANNIQQIERYQNAILAKGRALIMEYDEKMKVCEGLLTEEANEKICKMVKEQTTDTLGKILLQVSQNMKNGYHLADN
ncbi:MAG: C69 family dipeptidase [Lachnospiraceae bacterium]|nr:C69 family dipeptidase [Lachnospiraceae bacterium]